jgi:hypothetical protein
MVTMNQIEEGYDCFDRKGIISINHSIYKNQ